MCLPSSQGHASAVPRGGGIGIAIVCMAGLFVVDGASARFLLPWCFTALTICIIGFIDDVHGLSAAPRMAMQLIAAIATTFVYGGFAGLSLPIAGYVEFSALAGVLTVVWIVGFTNAFNFMDGLDGIAGVQALAAGAAWAFIGYRHNDPLVLHLGILLAAANAGFLVHNWSPARIFMGDAGSTFLGYTLAVLGLFDAATKHDSLIPALVLWPFLFDSAFTFLRRLRNHERVWTAHRSHLYQRLRIAGCSPPQISLLYLVLAATGGIAAAGIDGRWLSPRAAITIVAALAAALWLLVVRVEATRHQQPTNTEPASVSPR